jgi:hypothetical protein
MTLDEALDYARAVGLTDRQIAVVVQAEADRVRFLQDNGDVTLTHPDTGAEIRVAPSAVDQHELAGWVRVQPPEEAPPEAETPKAEPAKTPARKAK